MLAHLFNQQFHLHRCFRQFLHGGFGAQGIGFAIELLHHEIEPLANLTAFFENRTRLSQMSRQARELFRHIHAYAVERYLLPYAVLQIGWEGAAITHRLPEGFLHAFNRLLAKLLDGLRHQRCNASDDVFDIGYAREQHRLQ